jgi:hypothetical protein
MGWSIPFWGVLDRGAAGIGRWMIHDAAGIGGRGAACRGWANNGLRAIDLLALASLEPEVGAPAAPPLMNRPTDRGTCGRLGRCADRWAMFGGVVARCARHHPDDVTSVARSHKRFMPGIAGVGFNPPFTRCASIRAASRRVVIRGPPASRRAAHRSPPDPRRVVIRGPPDPRRAVDHPPTSGCEMFAMRSFERSEDHFVVRAEGVE